MQHGTHDPRAELGPGVTGPLPARLAISLFPAPARYRTTPDPRDVTWDELVALLSTHERRRALAAAEEAGLDVLARMRRTALLGGAS